MKKCSVHQKFEDPPKYVKPEDIDAHLRERRDWDRDGAISFPEDEGLWILLTLIPWAN